MELLSPSTSLPVDKNLVNPSIWCFTVLVALVRKCFGPLSSLVCERLRERHELVSHDGKPNYSKVGEMVQNM